MSTTVYSPSRPRQCGLERGPGTKLMCKANKCIFGQLSQCLLQPQLARSPGHYHSCAPEGTLPGASKVGHSRNHDPCLFSLQPARLPKLPGTISLHRVLLYTKIMPTQGQFFKFKGGSNFIYSIGTKNRKSNKMRRHSTVL